MKINSNQRTIMLSQGQLFNFSVIFFYGEDGAVFFESKRFLDQFPNFLRVEDPNDLFDEINQMSMFHKRKVLFCANVQEKHVFILEKIWKNLNNSLLIITAGLLLPKSKLRIMAERYEMVAILPCYADSQYTKKMFSMQYLQDKGYTLTRDAKEILYERISSNRLNAIQTLEKLMLFAGNDKVINRYDVDQVVTDMNFIIGQLALYAFSGHLSCLKFLEYGGQQRNISRIAIIRNFAEHARRLLLLIELIQETGSFELAFESMTPKIFFSDRPFFKEQSKKWSKKSLLNVLRFCFQTEIFIKNGHNSTLSCDLFVMRIVHFVRRFN